MYTYLGSLLNLCVTVAAFPLHFSHEYSISSICKSKMLLIYYYIFKKVLVVSCRTLCYFQKKYNKLAGKVAKDSLFIESVL